MLDKIALTLLIIGGLNWGSVGIFSLILLHGFAADRQDHKPYCLHPCRTFRNLVHYTFIQGHKQHRDRRNGFGFVDFMNYCNVEANRVRQPCVLHTVERNVFKFKNTDKK